MDWKAIIDELLAAGWSQAAIANHMDRSQSWVSQVSRRVLKDVTWHDGERLRKLHSRVMRQQKTKGSKP